MVKVNCSVCGIRDEPGLTFHKFPIDVQRCNEWAKLVGLYDLVDLAKGVCNKNYGLCGFHFARADFDGNNLKDSANPFSLNGASSVARQGPTSHKTAPDVVLPTTSHAYEEAHSSAATAHAPDECGGLAAAAVTSDPKSVADDVLMSQAREESAWETFLSAIMNVEKETFCAKFDVYKCAEAHVQMKKSMKTFFTVAGPLIDENIVKAFIGGLSSTTKKTSDQ